MRIDALATEHHYASHILPIWHALTDAERGSFYIGRRPDALRAVQGIEARTGLPSGSDAHPVVVAGYSDLRRVPRGRPVILVEHGVGARYKRPDGEWDRNPSNPGGSHREAVRLFICPNEDVAAANLEAYPDAKVAVVGCPRLDRWHRVTEGLSMAGNARGGQGHGVDPGTSPLLQSLGAEGQRESRSRTAQTPEAGPQDRGADQVTRGHPPPVTIAIAFHWDNRQCPESRWALRHFVSALPTLARDVSRRYKSEVRVIGHAHPRAWRQLERLYRELGIEPVQDLDEVFQRADLLVADNTSALYEFASLGRPVVCMNAPFYRRDVHHGLRFWSHVPGLQVNDPARLASRIVTALEDPPEAQALRRAAVERAYCATDGWAAERAVRAIREVFGVD